MEVPVGRLQGGLEVKGQLVGIDLRAQFPLPDRNCGRSSKCVHPCRLKVGNRVLDRPRFAVELGHRCGEEAAAGEDPALDMVGREAIR